MSASPEVRELVSQIIAVEQQLRQQHHVGHEDMLNEMNLVEFVEGYLNDPANVQRVVNYLDYVMGDIQHKLEAPGMSQELSEMWSHQLNLVEQLAQDLRPNMGLDNNGLNM